MAAILQIDGLTKSFTLHNQGSVLLDVLGRVDLSLHPAECLVLQGRSGAGKSTLLRTIYGNYKPGGGRILVHHRGGWVDLAHASPRCILEVRHHTIGFVSQFLRVIPRVPAIEIWAHLLRACGMPEEEALARAGALLARLNIPERLWALAPATFSGGEQQRINIARGFAVSYPIMLLDEPTAALDVDNRLAVEGLIREALAAGTAIIGVFHDAGLRDRLATRRYDMTEARSAA
jgi:alpha-D-ribose 1-methylphosphonate 5-triphosphate synthase subunit PhnL